MSSYAGLPFLLAFLAFVIYLRLRHSQAGQGSWEGYEASSGLTWTSYVASANSAAALCLIQAVLTTNVLYALLAVAIGGLLVLSHK